MLFRLLFFAFAATILTENVASDLDLPGIVELGLRMILLNVKRIGSVTLINETIVEIPDTLKNISIGSADLSNTQINGLETLEILRISASNLAASDNGTRINLCVNVTIDRLGFSTNYDADIGILNSIPVYGDGEINLTVKSDVGLCLNINIDEGFSKFYVDNLTLLLGLRDSPSYITNFWKNDDVSNLVTDIINILETVGCMWFSYEKECISCVISPLVEFIVNFILPNDIEKEIDIQCPCIENILGNKYNVAENLKEFVYSYYEGNTTNYLLKRSPEDYQEFFEDMKNNILMVLKNEGFTIEM